MNRSISTTRPNPCSTRTAPVSTAGLLRRIVTVSTAVVAAAAVAVATTGMASSTHQGAGAGQTHLQDAKLSKTAKATKTTKAGKTTRATKAGRPRVTVKAARRAAVANPSYSINHNATDGTVVRWDPCRPIAYQVNLANAPQGALADVTEAVHRISLASGLSFSYGGTTSDVPQSNWGDAGDNPPLTIAWALPGSGAGHSDALAPGAAGVGGYSTQGFTNDGTTWTYRITTAFVVLDAKTSATVKPGFAARPSLGSLLLHELGHAVGLNHASSTREVMYPILVNGQPSAFGPGDLIGLAKVGAGNGCIPDPAASADAQLTPAG
jgi:hypothetical protein